MQKLGYMPDTWLTVTLFCCSSPETKKIASANRPWTNVTRAWITRLQPVQISATNNRRATTRLACWGKLTLTVALFFAGKTEPTSPLPTNHGAGGREGGWGWHSFDGSRRHLPPFLLQRGTPALRMRRRKDATGYARVKSHHGHRFQEMKLHCSTDCYSLSLCPSVFWFGLAWTERWWWRRWWWWWVLILRPLLCLGYVFWVHTEAIDEKAGENRRRRNKLVKPYKWFQSQVHVKQNLTGLLIQNPTQLVCSRNCNSIGYSSGYRSGCWSGAWCVNRYNQSLCSLFIEGLRYTSIIRNLVPSVLLSSKMAIKLGDAGTIDHFGLAF